MLDIFGCQPRVRVERFCLPTQRVHARRIAPALDNPRQQLGVPRPQTRELIGPGTLASRFPGRAERLLELRLRELFECLLHLCFRGIRFKAVGLDGLQVSRNLRVLRNFLTFGKREIRDRGSRPLRGCRSGWPSRRRCRRPGTVPPPATITRVLAWWRRLGFQNPRPIEGDVGILLFDQADGRVVERWPADLHAGWGAEPIKEAIPRPSISAGGLNKRRCFVPAFVAGNPQKWQSYLRLAGRAAFFAGRAAGRFLAAACRPEAFAEAADVFADAAFGFELVLGATARTVGAGAL